MYRSSLSTKGQVVIPRVIRERLGLRAGDKIDFVLSDSGEVAMRPATADIRSLKGCVKVPKGEAVSVEDMNRAIREEGGSMP